MPAALISSIVLKIVWQTMRREAERRLVEQQQLRPRHQRARDRQHLLLAARQRAGALLHALLAAAETSVKPRSRSLLDRCLVLREIGAHLEVLEHRQVGEDAAPFGRHRDAARDELVRRAAR